MKRYSKDEIDEVAEILKNDGVVSVPTDTVYGICARINSKKAYEKLVDVKKRPSNKSFPVLCLDEEQIKSIAIVDVKAEKLIRAFMPGPITLVLNKRPEVFSYINNAGTRISDELAVRIVPLKILEELIEKTGSPLFLTSANISGENVCNSLDDIEKVFPYLDGILEGDISFGQASTIVDCTNGEIKIQREGPISIEEIMEVLKK
ncbi:MAG: L-threonylcarbamoyladenylate synthase [Bacilli bacterium]|nr:L-threonylcarbamoyladenylate synthase [Bacilli bacterium]